MIPINPAELAFLQFQVEEELETQRRVVIARDLYEGNLPDGLTEELKNGLLAGGVDHLRDLFNVYAAVVDEVNDRLSVEGFYDHPDINQGNEVEWAEQHWRQARLNEIQHVAMLYALRDGESFIILEPYENPYTQEITVRPYLHQRYTDAKVNGDNEGMKVHYRNNYMPGAEPIAASKRWIETIVVDGRRETQKRLTLYVPTHGEEEGRIEKYVEEAGDWKPIKDENDEGWPIPWPYELPIVHFRNIELKQQGIRAQGPQALLDNAMTALASATSSSAVPTLVVLGGYPTTDGEKPEDGGGNLWQLGPRKIVGFASAAPDEASIDYIRPADLSQIMNVAELILKFTAIVTSTPSLQAHNLSRLPIAADALKQMDIRPIAITRRLQDSFGDAWSQYFRLVVTLNNEFGNTGSLPEEPVYVSWLPADVRGAQALLSHKDETRKGMHNQEPGTNSENPSAEANESTIEK